MLDSRKELLLVKGEDKTDSIENVHWLGSKCDIQFRGSPKVYSYNASQVQRLRLVKSLDPAAVIVKHEGRALAGVTALYDFGAWVRIVRENSRGCSFPRDQLVFEEDCLNKQSVRDLMAYFRAVADVISVTTEDDVRILSRQFERILQISDQSVLAKYLNHQEPACDSAPPEGLIFPFGVNLSQKAAVEQAFASQVSIIQGPPGTGKTQTLLSIIANALMQGKTVVVVSNNNAATANVVEKLEKHGLDFFTATLGSKTNKEHFLAGQSGQYPDMSKWCLEAEERDELHTQVRRLVAELDRMLAARNRIAEIKQELAATEQELHYFEQYFVATPYSPQAERLSRGLSSDQALELWLQGEHLAASGSSLSWWQKVGVFFRHGLGGLALFKLPLSSVVPALQRRYYFAREAELAAEQQRLERQLGSYRFGERLAQVQGLSMRLLQSKLAERYNYREPRRIFTDKSIFSEPAALLREYPVVLSTTYSIRSVLAGDYLYDYLLVDEASQVDVVTGALALSCAKRVVIVGDSKQLPNVVSEATRKVTDEIWARFSFEEHFNYSQHSLLSSVISAWPSAPSTLLREHYRCHPKIAGFCNQKFYDNQLIVLTEDKGEADVLTLYRTPPGNHARGHLNQRQIDCVIREILPDLTKQGHSDIGIIAPYREQVHALTRQLPRDLEVDTVHKFQGREKESIVLSSVDDRISPFVDDPHILNVAISRAIKRLAVIMPHDPGNSSSNWNDLARYIEYNNFQVVESSVYSVFDLLYQAYSAKRRQLLGRTRRVSEYDSENLAYALIDSVLHHEEFRSLACAVHVPLNTLVKDFGPLTSEEATFARNPLTHTDFLLYRKMDKTPVLVVEVDGVRYHQAGTRQAERDGMKDAILAKCGIKLLRLRTDGSGEERRLVEALHANL